MESVTSAELSAYVAAYVALCFGVAVIAREQGRAIGPAFGAAFLASPLLAWMFYAAIGPAPRCGICGSRFASMSGGGLYCTGSHADIRQLPQLIQASVREASQQP